MITLTITFEEIKPNTIAIGYKCDTHNGEPSQCEQNYAATLDQLYFKPGLDHLQAMMNAGEKGWSKKIEGPSSIVTEQVFEEMKQRIKEDDKV